MLTPAFDLSQDATFLKILIKARYANVTEVEIYVDGNDFKFYAKPYFLRLQLPGRVVEDGREKAKYDVDTGAFEILLPKETPGEVFEGLDMLTTLLAPRGQRSAAQPGIEITGDVEAEGQCRGSEDDQGEIDWQVEQQPFHLEEDSLRGEAAYGFAHRRRGVFQRLQEELCGVVDVSHPDTAQVTERKQARVLAEDQKFDADHYLADLYSDESAVEELLAHRPPWHQEWRRQQAESKQAASAMSDRAADGDEELVHLTEAEKEQLRRLPRRRHLLDGETERAALLSLVDIIFAYAYNARTTLSENSVESAWTICKLSPTLSWLDWFTCLDEVVAACYRRALCYPLYRHWELTAKVFQDVKRIFQLGRRRLLKCLLEIHRLLAADEPRYILNELYITDYCVWIQSLRPGTIASLAAALKKVKMIKSKVGFELEELEEAAELATGERSGPEGASSPVHQYGYPHLLHEALESDDIREEERPDVSEVKRSSLGDEAAPEEQETEVDGVAAEMSHLELSEKECDERAAGSVPDSGKLSLEAWSLQPPARRIELFDEDPTGPCDDAQSDLGKSAEKSAHQQDVSRAAQRDNLPGESSSCTAGMPNRDPEVNVALLCPHSEAFDPSLASNQSADVKPEQDSQSVNRLEAQPAAGSHPGSESDSNSNDSESDSDSEPDSDSDSDSGMESDSGAESDSESDPGLD